MIDRDFMISTYSNNSRPYPRAIATRSQQMTSMLAILIAESQRAWLQADFAYRQSGRHPSHAFSHFFTTFFSYFDTELRACIYEIASTGTTITRELIDSLLTAPMPEQTPEITHRVESFPNDFLHRTCDLGYGWTKQHELDHVPQLANARFDVVAESGLYLAHYDKIYPRDTRTYSQRDYVVLRENSLRWLDLADDTGEFADLNFVFIQ